MTKNRFYLKQLPKVLCFFFIASLMYVFAYKTCFITYQEIFPYANICGELCCGMSMAYITSFVFYYLSIHYREEKAKDETIWFLYKKLNEVIYQSRILYKEMNSRKGGSDFNYQIFINDFSKIWCNDKTGYNICDNGCVREQTFADLYYDIPLDINKLVTMIYIRAPFIEPQILSCLLEIEECEYMRRNPEIKSLNRHSKFIHPLPSQYIDFLKLIYKLEELLKSEKRVY